MTCREFQERLGDLFERRLPPIERREVQAHLLRCPECARSRRGYEKMVALTRAAYAPRPGDPEAAPPEEMVGRILAAARSKRSPSARWGLVQLISGIAASPLIVFYLGH